MTVNALATPPMPQNGNMDRAMYVWVGSVGSTSDPLRNDTQQNNLITFCGNNGVNVVFLDIWNYLGAGNWSAANRDVMKKFVSSCHASGIRVMALVGNSDWGHNLQWVGKNIIKRIAEFNAAGELVAATYEGAWFDGVMFDVEYWTVAGYNAQAELPGFLDLMKSTRQVLNVPVGCFASQWHVSSAAQTVTYNGITQLEGYHLMDVTDHVVVACYNNSGSTQVAMFQPWFDYVTQNTDKAGLWCGSETGPGQGTQSYNGMTKAQMEAQHAVVSAQFAVTSSLSFRGQAIDPYSSYLTMP